ncbi:VWA domain-containing protein [Pectobacterium polaris]|uniref:vWA domain-containing protein n=1 Tax=Pectobacterium polaris TaxID=2042057 RepID=UPI000E73B03D|nr:vWA domain-containing protein [Pectobacterium polaris]MDE8744496.1 VWA domain-containing protein [Pectobacterium polaris]MDE8757115.1 VWA domain-containing protein [Pectobacterium polaris]MDG0803608.1 VWA domain-containing protein [Pectobacterium polaris]RJL23130.1 VWA domain-containing protein [Pectobacterium polaris]
MIKIHFLRLALPLCSLLLTSQALAAEGDKPLLLEGKKNLYQRVLTTPGCKLVANAGDDKGKLQPAFSSLYVYQKADVNEKGWLKVGPDSYGKTIGWLPQSCTVDWKMQLTLAFTNPANRDRLVFFKERKSLDDILSAPDPVSLVAPLRAHLKRDSSADGVLAQEPEYFVDLQKQFYLLPILSGEEVMTENGFYTRILNVASVSKANAPAKPGDDINQLKGFNATVVFVIDSTISMGPYIERTKEAVNKIYDKIKQENLQEQVKFGLVSFRSSTKAVPGLEYTSKVFADPNKVEDGEDFLKKVASLKEAKVSSSLYDEDAYAGVLSAIDNIDWSPFGARYIVLITDAGAIEGSNKLSDTGLDAKQLRLEAGNRGIAIYTMHLKTPSGKDNHAKAEGQYRDISNFDSTQSNLYQSVDAGDLKTFGKQVDTLATAITEQVKSAYMGDPAIGSAFYAKDDEKKPTSEDKLLEDTALIGHAMQLAYLGKKNETQAPLVFKAWISDRDLIKQNIPTTDVRVLLNKGQLSDLSDVVSQILQAANEGMISPDKMFERLRTVAAAMGADPNQLKQKENTKINDLGVLGEYLADLPYRSDVLNLDEETWKSWDGLSQEKFIRTLSAKLRHYQKYNADVDRWVELAKDSDPRDRVYPVPLEMMP